MTPPGRSSIDNKLMSALFDLVAAQSDDSGEGNAVSMTEEVAVKSFLRNGGMQQQTTSIGST